jgi:hypothetical protein
MTKAEETFHRIAADIPDSKEGRMFGALCIKAPNGKAGVMFYRDAMVFKLTGDELQQALALSGATLFDPAGGRPMKGWVQVPFEHATVWHRLAPIAMDGVRAL